MPKADESARQFSQALQRLDEALLLQKTTIVRDSAIKRFEMCFDLAWEMMKALVEARGSECASPRACLQEMFRLDMLAYDEAWLRLLELRNASVHTYSEELAEKVYTELPHASEIFHALMQKVVTIPSIGM